MPAMSDAGASPGDGATSRVTTILILDDQATNRTVYARLARTVEEGVAVEAFADASEALEWLEYGRADLILTDFKMPGMDGAAFIRRLRSMPNSARTPVIVVTAHDNRSFRVRALDAGATDFLQSPIDHVELVTRARNLLALGRGWKGGAPAAPDAALPPARGVFLGADVRAMLDAMPAMVSVVDATGACIHVNSRLAAAHGLPAEDLLGLGLATRLDPRWLARSRREDRRVIEEGCEIPPYVDEYARVTRPGSRMLTTKSPLRDADGKVHAVLTLSVECDGGVDGGAPSAALPSRTGKA